jgi:hypothetical protein
LSGRRSTRGWLANAWWNFVTGALENGHDSEKRCTLSRNCDGSVPADRAESYRNNSSEATATRPNLAPEPETAKTPEIEATLSEHEFRSIGSVLGGFLGGLARPFENLISALADMFSAPPPMTPDQAERAERAAEENREASADQAAQQERSDNLDGLIAEMQKQRQQEEDFAARYGTPGGSGRDRDDDYDRGRERERWGLRHSRNGAGNQGRRKHGGRGDDHQRVIPWRR